MKTDEAHPVDPAVSTAPQSNAAGLNYLVEHISQVSTGIAIAGVLVAGLGFVTTSAGLSRFGLEDLAYEIPKARWLYSGFSFLLYFSFCQVVLYWGTFLEEAIASNEGSETKTLEGVLYLLRIPVIYGIAYFAHRSFSEAFLALALHISLFKMIRTMYGRITDKDYRPLIPLSVVYVLLLFVLAVIPVRINSDKSAKVTYTSSSGTTETMRLLLFHQGTAFVTAESETTRTIVLVPKERIQEIVIRAK